MQHSPVPTGGQGGWSDASVTVGFKDLNVCFVCMDVCAHACMPGAEARRGCRVSCNWSYRWFKAAKSVPAPELGSPVGAACA